MEKLKENDQKSLASHHVPIDLLTDIFLRVPPKSIARFRCISKYWSSTLVSPDFTELYFAKSITRPRHLFGIEDDGKSFFFSSLQPQNQDKNLSPILASILTAAASQTCRQNGLICRQEPRGRESVTVVYNLSTRESVTLPKVRTESYYSRSYFGFDPIKKQFKVLCMTWNCFHASNDSIEYWVLTLGNEELVWRKVEDSEDHIPLSDGICINGVLYYQAKQYSGVYMIVCFDIMSEKFSYIINIDRDMIKKLVSTLVNYKGKLGVLRAQNTIGVNIYTRDFVMWILEDDDGHKWSKHIYSIPQGWWKPGDQKLYIVGLTGTDEIVLSPSHLYNAFYVFYYNLENKTIRRVQIRGFEDFNLFSRVRILVDYVENVTPMKLLMTSL